MTRAIKVMRTMVKPKQRGGGSAFLGVCIRLPVEGPDLGGRVPPVVIRGERGQEPPDLPLVRGVVIDLQRAELAAARRQVHPARPDPLDTREQVRVEPDRGNGAP